MIPVQLQREDFRFIQLREPKLGEAYEQDNKKPAYGITWSDSKYHVSWDKIKKPNYGTLGGYGDLLIIDIDKQEIYDTLPEEVKDTFTVKTGRGYHIYLIVHSNHAPDISDTNVTVRFKKTGDPSKPEGYVVGAGSIHANGNIYKVFKDLPIKEVEFEVVSYALDPYCNHWFNEKEDYVNQSFDVQLSQVLDLSGLKNKGGARYEGKHPIHGAKTGINFSADLTKGVWHCFRCDSGGGAALWLAQELGILDCSECKTGALRGDNFVKVLKHAQDKGLIEKKVYTKKEEILYDGREGKKKGDASSDYVLRLLLNEPSEVSEAYVRVRREEYEKLQEIVNKKNISSHIEGSEGSVHSLLIDLLKRFMELPEASDFKFLTLWTIGTYFHSMFTHYPYVLLNAPKGSGKSKLLKLVIWSSYNGELSTNISSAALYNLIENEHCSLAFDESEVLSDKEKAQDITNILLGGFEKGNEVIRMPKGETGTNNLKKYSVYAPKILGNITGLSNDALESRCIPVRLLKTLDPSKANIYPNKTDAFFREFQILMLVFAFENWDKVKQEYDSLKGAGSLIGRSFNLFKPLLAVCKVAAPEWYDEFLAYAEMKVETLDKVTSQDSQEVLLLSALVDLIENDDKTQEVIRVHAKPLKALIENLSFNGVEQRWLSYRFINSLFKRLGWASKRGKDEQGVYYGLSKVEVLDVFARYSGEKVVSAPKKNGVNVSDFGSEVESFQRISEDFELP